MFWVLIATILIVVTGFLIWPLFRKVRNPLPREAFDQQLYQDQLAELAERKTQGLVSEEIEKETRLELQRRLLATAGTTTNGEHHADRPSGEPNISPWLAVALGLTVSIGALTLYGYLGSPELTRAEDATRSASIPTDVDADGDATLAALVPGLQERLEQTPDNAEGWALLGRSYLLLRQFKEASEALGRAGALAPENTDYARLQGEALYFAANERITDAALQAFQKAAELSPDDPGTRYYLALYQYQTGAIESAHEQWQALLASAPPEAEWAPMVRERLTETSAALNLAPSTALPGSAANAPRGPTTDDLAAAAEMSESERAAFVESMVERLAERLQREPDDPAGWQRLARAYLVLGKQNEALEAIRRGADVAPDDLSTQRAFAAFLVQNAETGAAISAEITAVHQRILALAPNDPQALWFVSLGEISAGRTDEAVALLERLLALLAPEASLHGQVQHQITELKALTGTRP